MCGRFYIDDETAREIEKIAEKIDRKHAKTGDVHPSEPALILRTDHDDMVAEVLAWSYETHRCLVPTCKFMSGSRPFRHSHPRSRGVYDWDTSSDASYPS